MIEHLKRKGNSKIQESIAEYSFLKDLLIDGVRNNINVLISRSDFDKFGYDVLAQREDDPRVFKIQLKAVNGKASVWDVHESLIKDENGRVVLVKINEGKNDLNFKYYSLTSSNRDQIIKRSPKKANPKKCKLNKGDLEHISKDKLLSKILN